MKKKAKSMILFAALILIVAFAVILYPLLSQQYPGTGENTLPAETEDSIEKAPDFTVYDTSGKAINLSDMIGKPTIVNFWATWCRYCVEELPEFDRYAKEYGDQINFMMVDLPDGYRETKEKALAFTEKEGYGFPIYLDSDGSASNTYRIMGIPMTLLINQDGSLYKVHNGLMNEVTLKQYIEILTGETTENENPDRKRYHDEFFH